MRAITLLACAAALVPQNKPPSALSVPERPQPLTGVRAPQLAPQTEVCAEHGEPVATKTVLTPMGPRVLLRSSDPLRHFRSHKSAPTDR